MNKMLDFHPSRRESDVVTRQDFYGTTINAFCKQIENELLVPLCVSAGKAWKLQNESEGVPSFWEIFMKPGICKGACVASGSEIYKLANTKVAK